MTDQITDQDRRDARQWAEAIGRSDAPCAADLWHAASRVILATVEVPATALADELRHIAEHWEEWATDTITSAIRAAADRAEQTEQELDESRAEVENFTAEAAEMNAATVTSDQRANMQGILAGSRPDPADVKPGEAWMVECDGEHRPAVKDAQDIWCWCTVNNDGNFRSESNLKITLVSRLVPEPRVITNPDELDQLGYRTVILSTDGQADVYQKDSNGEWLDVTSHGYPSLRVISMENAVTVLWEPGA